MTTATTISDEELVARCQRELPERTQSYELLVQRYMNRVFSIVYRIVAHKEEAEDITQEVFVKVFYGLKKFEQQASFSTWLYRIATNTALDHLDRLKRQKQATSWFSPSKAREQESPEDESDPLSLYPSQEAGPEEKSMQRELRECISSVLRQLERHQAGLLIMRDFDDLSYDQIAQALKIGLSAAKMRIHRARMAFQELFANMCGSYLLSSLSQANATKGTGKEG